MRSIDWYMVIGTSCLMLSSAGDALARPCSGNAECPRGSNCFPFTEAPGGGSAGSCTSLSCEGDSDCAAGTRCFFYFDEQCVAAADGGQSCGPGNVCVRQWQAPCTADSDCGPGFTCSGTGGLLACGPNQNQAQATQGRPYAVASVVPCTAGRAPLLPPFCNMADAGSRLCPPDPCNDSSTCLSIHWSTCVPQQTGPCTLDSDCPATWSCQCPPSCGFASRPSIALDAAVAPSDAGCTKTCMAPNSDLSNGGDCFSNAAATVEASSGAADVRSTPSGVADTGLRGALDAGSARSAAAPTSTRAHGGCRIIDDEPAPATSWGVLAMCGFACWLRLRNSKRSG